MAIQVGTVDGLINITTDKIQCFTKGIEYFSRECVDLAKVSKISVGTAFQRLIEPVYKGETLQFDKSTIKDPVFTNNGKEQSPARVTYCKKMGLAKVDEINYKIELTDLSEALLSADITTEEYAFILLSKQGIFVDDIYQENLLVRIAKWFKENSYLTEDSLKNYCCQMYNDSSVKKTRFDIILNAFVFCGLLIKSNDKYFLADILAAKILDNAYLYASSITQSELDSSDHYSDYIGSLNYGVFDIINNDNASIIKERYPNLLKFTTIKNKCSSFAKESANLYPYLTAIRTKPFILLAGISGTGKSRIVRKLAQATDTIGSYADDAARFACHSPENFCLIQVKPNWHNSMDVVGFKSNIGKDGEHYEFTPFVEFIAKAWQHPDVPFFLCLDEMNLAPVEEYFAEFLSAIESRSIDAEGHYETDPIIKPFESFGKEVCRQMITHLLGAEPDTNLAEKFTTKGLTLPQNLIVMGTVNMDETTFSFSRKVLDRAMSIEMNEVDYDAFLEGSTEMDVPVLVENNALLIKRFIKAQDVKDNIDAQAVKDFLNDVNNVLEGTPFKLGYRAANEAMLYVSAAKDFGNDNLAAALDEFTLMKILSRIEGDDTKLRTMMGEDILQELNHLFSTGMFSGMESSKTLVKLNQMIKSLERDHFVSFWG